MDEFANLPIAEKKPYYEKASAEKGISIELIEKDFWVSWVLSKLFSFDRLGKELLFKGGTSLSKVYRVIERFSEDIDITVSRELLGFSGENNPEQAESNKQRERILVELSKACKEFVRGELKQSLESSINVCLMDVSSECAVIVDQDDPDEQTLLFKYPTVSNVSHDQYVSPEIKIELGARGGSWPIVNKTIQPIIEEEVPDSIEKSMVSIRVLDVKRTFWEKAVILHKYAHFPEEKTVPERQSRHYFDFYKLINSEFCDEAKGNIDLLRNVVEHNKIYFRTGWANYDLAEKGTLDLVGNDRVLQEMSADYKKMDEMIYSEPIEWDVIISEITKFEQEFNQD